MAHGDAGTGFFVVVKRLGPEIDLLDELAAIHQSKLTVDQVYQVRILRQRCGVGQDGGAVPQQQGFWQVLDFSVTRAEQIGAAHLDRLIHRLQRPLRVMHSPALGINLDRHQARKPGVLFQNQIKFRGFLRYYLLQCDRHIVYLREDVVQVLT
jgi:hypothetical protein